jgi:hypothetical protein
VAGVGEEETKRGLSGNWNGEWRIRVRSWDDVTVLDCSLDSELQVPVSRTKHGKEISLLYNKLSFKHTITSPSNL